MSKSSEAVKKWREKTKQRIVDAMGGECVICGYNKCNASLSLHHLDPSQKDIVLSAIRASPKNWQAIVVELRKCVLVCHNCHTEVHNDYAIVPQYAARFNEEFADYKALEKANWPPCPICDGPKAIHNITCSPECGARMRYKIDWDKIDFVEELKHNSIIGLANKLGCSDATIHKRLKRLGLK